MNKDAPKQSTKISLSISPQLILLTGIIGTAAALFSLPAGWALALGIGTAAGAFAGDIAGAYGGAIAARKAMPKNIKPDLRKIGRGMLVGYWLGHVAGAGAGYKLTEMIVKHKFNKTAEAPAFRNDDKTFVLTANDLAHDKTGFLYKLS